VERDVHLHVRDFPAMEPNLDDLFRPKRFTFQQVIVILLLCVLGAWMLWPSSHPRPSPRPAPPPARKTASPPLYVTVVPEEESGWCCVAGKVAAASKAACKGTFFATEAEAKKACPTAPPGSPRGRGTGV
jgi:hypothetical protein